MFFRRILISLILQHLQRINELHTGYTWLDHFINVASTGRDVRAGELLDVFRNQLFAPLFRVSRLLNLVFKEDIYRTVGPHYRYLGCWPSIIDITSNMFTAHHIVRTTVGFTCDNG